MLLDVTGSLTFTDGVGTGSTAQVISNNGLGYLQVSYLDCVGCDTGLSFLDQPITNTAANEIVSTQNDSVITLDAAVSSTDALIGVLDEEDVPMNETEAALVTDVETAVADDEEQTGAESETEAHVLVCR